MERYTVTQFNQDFPDNDTCLEWLKNHLYPDGIYCPICKKVTKHHKIASRPSYSCDYCGHHVHPTVGTIFEKSTTPLRLWFYAMFIMSATRCGVSAKQLQRELGVTYKTAWRMAKQIRILMADECGEPLDGDVEVDETFIGGNPKNRRKIW